MIVLCWLKHNFYQNNIWINLSFREPSSSLQQQFIDKSSWVKISLKSPHEFRRILLTHSMSHASDSNELSYSTVDSIPHMIQANKNCLRRLRNQDQDSISISQTVWIFPYQFKIIQSLFDKMGNYRLRIVQQSRFIGFLIIFRPHSIFDK